MNEYTVSYAQNREDIIIEAFFPGEKSGFYVDVGANHPIRHSVTKLFYDKGWNGINFEPNPKLHKMLTRYRPRDKNILQGVGDMNRLLEFRIYHSRDGLEGISTLSSRMKKTYSSSDDEDTENYTDIKVPVRTLKQSLAENDVKHISFMKIDVEGYEYEVLSGNDWVKYRPELICIEANHIKKDWRPLLEKAGYNIVFNDGLNDYYLADESLERKKNFDYAKVFLLSEPVITFDIMKRIKSTTDKLELTLLENKNLKEQLRVQQAFIDEITPLKRHFKRQLQIRLNRFLKKSS